MTDILFLESTCIDIYGYNVCVKGASTASGATKSGHIIQPRISNARESFKEKVKWDALTISRSSTG
jgi:hypothetical protein